MIIIIVVQSFSKEGHNDMEGAVTSDNLVDPLKLMVCVNNAMCVI